MRIDTLLQAVQKYLVSERRLDQCRPREAERGVLEREVALARERLRAAFDARGARADGPAAFGRILVAVDQSEQATFAVDLGARLADDLDAQLVLMHVFCPSCGFTPDFGLICPDLFEDGMRTGEELLERAKARVPEAVDIRTHVRHGDPATEIERAAATLGADLIVMGTHGRGPLGQALLGSVANHVTRKAPCPVLLVAHGPARGNVAPVPLKETVVPQRDTLPVAAS